MPRFDTPSRQEFPELEDMFKLWETGMGYLPNSALQMALKPEMFKAFGGLVGQIMGPGTLDPGLKSLIAFMASKGAGCNYCMAHTSEGAVMHRGIAQAKMDAIWEYERSDLFSDAERAALTVAQGAGATPNTVSDTDFAALKTHFSKEEIVEIVSVIAIFGFLNRWNDTMATPLEDLPRAFAEQHLQGKGWALGSHG